MTTELSLREAKAKLSEVLDRVAAGETIEIVRRGAHKGRYRILAIGPAPPRKPGRLAGKLVVPDDFNAPDDEVADAFEGKG